MKLTRKHHKIFLPLAGLLVLILGVFLGLQITQSSPEPQMLGVLTFGLCFLNTLLLVIVFSIQIHHEKH